MEKSCLIDSRVRIFCSCMPSYANGRSHKYRCEVERSVYGVAPNFNLVSQKRLHLLHVSGWRPGTFGSRPRLKQVVSGRSQTREFCRSTGRLGCSSWSSRDMFLLVWSRTLFPDGPGCCDDISQNAPTNGLAGGRAVDESLNPAQVGWTCHGAISIVDRRTRWRFVYSTNRRWRFYQEKCGTSWKPSHCLKPL